MHQQWLSNSRAAFRMALEETANSQSIMHKKFNPGCVY